jgi:hypothetical protein
MRLLSASRAPSRRMLGTAAIRLATRGASGRSPDRFGPSLRRLFQKRGNWVSMDVLHGGNPGHLFLRFSASSGFYPPRHQARRLNLRRRDELLHFERDLQWARERISSPRLASRCPAASPKQSPALRTTRQRRSKRAPRRCAAIPDSNLATEGGIAMTGASGARESEVSRHAPPIAERWRGAAAAPPHSLLFSRSRMKALSLIASATGRISTKVALPASPTMNHFNGPVPPFSAVREASIRRTHMDLPGGVFATPPPNPGNSF